MKTTAYGVAVAAFVLVGCHTITEELPTEPSKTPASGVLTVPIPTIPVVGTPKPSPKPSPTPGPTPTPAPTPTPSPTPSANGCGNPVPGPTTRMTVKIHTMGPNNWTLDSTPLVGPDAEYCRQSGFTDGRQYCAVRNHGVPDREACEAISVGNARDTGRPGPTWYWNGQLCSEQPSHCDNSDNQYLLLTYTSGTFMACSSNDVCASVEVVR